MTRYSIRPEWGGTWCLREIPLKALDRFSRRRDAVTAAKKLMKKGDTLEVYGPSGILAFRFPELQMKEAA